MLFGWLTALAVAAVGLPFGALAAASGLCTMGALSDLFLFGSRRRLRWLALALAIAMLGGAALSTLDFPVSPSVLAASAAGLLAAGAGGVLLGVGMVLAGGCPTRLIARSGERDVSAQLALATLLAVGLPVAALAGMPAAPAGLLGGPRLPAWVGAVAAVAIGAWALADGRVRAAPRDLATAGLLGALVTMATIVLPTLGGLNPLAALLAAAGHDAGLALAGLGLLAAALLGAAVVGSGRARPSIAADRAGLLRHLAGGALQGLGGGLALACSLGHGLTGLAALAPASLVALAGIALGVRLGLAWLEGRRLRLAQLGWPWSWRRQAGTRS